MCIPFLCQNSTLIVNLTFDNIHLFILFILQFPHRINITERKRKNILLRASLHEGGGPQVGEITCGRLPHLTCKRDHIKMRDYMDRRATPPKRVTSPIWGTPPPCKQALRLQIYRAGKATKIVQN